MLVGSCDAVNVNETLLAELTLTAVAESAAIDTRGRVTDARLLLYRSGVILLFDPLVYLAPSGGFP